MSDVLLVAVSDEDAADYQRLYPELLKDAVVVCRRDKIEGRRTHRVFITEFASISVFKDVRDAAAQALTLGAFRSDVISDLYPIHLRMPTELLKESRRLGKETK